MANSDAPFGLRPVRHLSGGVIRMSEYPLATAGNNIYTNDLVALATGRVNQAAAGDRPLGVFAGCRVVKSNGEVVYNTWYQPGQYTGAIEQTAFVYDDPNIVYHIQVDDDTTPLSTLGTAVNRNIDIIITTTGSQTAGISRTEGDATSLTSGAAQLRILGLAKFPNNAWGGNEVVEVKLNEHVWLATGIVGQS